MTILLNEHHGRDSVHSGLPQTGDLSDLPGLSRLIESAFCLTVLIGIGRFVSGVEITEWSNACLNLSSGVDTVLVIVLLLVIAA